MDIQITTKKSEGVERLLEVSVPVDAVREAEEKTARRYASTVGVPVFRPGKVPTAIVRKRFKDAIRQQVLETLLNEAYQEVVQREGLRVAAQPHVHDVHFTDGQPLTFELHVELRPEIELARTSGFRLKRPPSEITDEQVAEQIERLREERATWTPVEERPTPGDMVTVELATAEGEAETPEVKDYRIVVGAAQAIPGIEELIMELSPAETRERPV